MTGELAASAVASGEYSVPTTDVVDGGAMAVLMGNGAVRLLEVVLCVPDSVPPMVKEVVVGTEGVEGVKVIVAVAVAVSVVRIEVTEGVRVIIAVVVSVVRIEDIRGERVTTAVLVDVSVSV